MIIQSLHSYPLKGGRGLDHQSAQVRPRGLAGDRRFMLINEKNRFVTQREMQDLAQLQVKPFGVDWLFSYKDDGPIHVDVECFTERVEASVWKSQVDVSVAEDYINDRISSWFDLRFLLFMSALKIFSCAIFSAIVSRLYLVLACFTA